MAATKNLTRKAQQANGEAFKAKVNGGGHGILGELVSWSIEGVEVRHTDVQKALAAAGLDDKVLRDPQFRHAFSRACHKLEDERLIRLFDEDEDKMEFQFTKEVKAAAGLDYVKETMLILDKRTGKITCAIADLAAKATEAMTKEIEFRTSSDITRLVQRLFDRQDADLWPARKHGGVYFVFAAKEAFVSQVDQFITGLGGEMSRWPIPAGTDRGNRSVGDAVKDGMEARLYEYEAAVEKLCLASRKDTIEGIAEAIESARFKADCYKEFLGDSHAKLEKAIAKLDARLKKKIGARDAIKEAGYYVPCDHCQAQNAVKEGTPKVVCEACDKTFEVSWE